MEHNQLARAAGPGGRRPPKRPPATAPPTETESESGDREKKPTLDVVKRQRTMLKRQAREWERAFEAKHGAKPSNAERRADVDYVRIRRSLKHADEALGIFASAAADEPLDESAQERLSRAVTLAGLAGYWTKQSRQPPRHPQAAARAMSGAASDAASEANFEARMEARDASTLQQAASGKLIAKSNSMDGGGGGGGMGMRRVSSCSLSIGGGGGGDEASPPTSPHATYSQGGGGMNRGAGGTMKGGAHDDAMEEEVVVEVVRYGRFTKLWVRLITGGLTHTVPTPTNCGTPKPD